LLAASYRRGFVSCGQALPLARGVRPSTQSRWIRYARQVTVRRLEDVIVHLDAGVARPSIADSAEAAAHIGAPLPPRIDAGPPGGSAQASEASAPALPLHTSAPDLE